MVDTRFSTSVHIMTALACAKDCLVTSPTLAHSVRTSPIVVRRLVSKLVEHGLVKSFRGKTGGIELARGADQITLRDIYEATTDKPLLAVSEKPAQKSCVVSCAMGKILDDVVMGLENRSLEYLQGIKLSELAERVRD